MKRIFVVNISNVEWRKTYLILAKSVSDAIAITERDWYMLENCDTITCFVANGMNF